MFEIGTRVYYSGNSTITDMPVWSEGKITEIRPEGKRTTIVVDFGFYGIRYMRKSQLKKVA